MAYVPPTFNLVCNLWNWNAAIPLGAPRVAGQVCQLRAPKMDMSEIIPLQPNTTWANVMFLLLPARTDIRDGNATNPVAGDICECPAGTGRYYKVLIVDDVGRGFMNEYRFALLQKHINVALTWPVPIP